MGADRHSDSARWQQIEMELGLDNEVEKVIHREDRGLRIYIRATDVWKVQINDQPVPEHYVQDLNQEAAYAIHARYISGVVKVQSIWSDMEKTVLILDRIPGTQLNKHNFTCAESLRIISQLFWLVSSLTKLRILHGDLAIHNFIVTPTGQVVVIDFGQAQKAPFWTCVSLNWFRRGAFHGKRTFPISGTVVRCLEFCLPTRARALYRRLLRIAPYVDNAD